MNKIEIGSTVIVNCNGGFIDDTKVRCLVLDVSGRKVSVMDDESNAFTVSINDIELCQE